TGIPGPAAGEIEHSDLHLAILDGGPAIVWEVVYRTHLDPGARRFPGLGRNVSRLLVEHLELHQRRRFPWPTSARRLTTFADDLDARLGLVGVDELPEPFAFLRILDGLSPFTRIGINQELHTLF